MIYFSQEDDKWYVKFYNYVYDHFWRYSKLRDAYYYIRNRFFCKYYLVDTGLPKHQWSDICVKMLYANMVMLKDYVEKEKALEIICWDDDEFHRNAKKEILDIYNWWNNYPNREKENDKALDDWFTSSHKDGEDFLEHLNGVKTEEEQRLFKLLNEMEDKLTKEEEEMLIRLIKIRNFLWT